MDGIERSTHPFTAGYLSRPVTKTWKEKLNRQFEAYGPVAIGTFLVLWVISVAGIVFAMSFFGWTPKNAEGSQVASVGFWAKVGIGYVALKTTTIPRIAITLLITPLVAKLLGRSPKTPTPQP